MKEHGPGSREAMHRNTREAWARADTLQGLYDRLLYFHGYEDLVVAKANATKLAASALRNQLHRLYYDTWGQWCVGPWELAAKGPPVEYPQWAPQVYDLITQGDGDGAIDLVYENVEALLSEDRMSSVDYLFGQLKPSSTLTAEVATALLIVTLGAKSKLLMRAKFLEGAQRLWGLEAFKGLE